MVIATRERYETGFQTLLRAITPKELTSGQIAKVAELVEGYRKGPPVIKVGGAALKEQCGDNVFGDIRTLGMLGIYPALVHGGGKEIDDEMKARGIKITRINGQRVSDDATISVVKKVMPDIGHAIMNALIEVNIDAVHVWGHGGILEVEMISPELQYVGKVTNVKTRGLLGFTSEGIIPVVTPLGFKEDQVFNINADLAASSIAGAMKAVKIVFVTNVNGIFDGNCWRQQITIKEIDNLLETGKIDGGMIPKVEAVKSAVRLGVPASIINGKNGNSLLSHLFGFNGSGTEVTE